MTIKIAIDVMGGDNAPLVPLQACEIFLNNNQDINQEVYFHLFGNKHEIDKIMKDFPLLSKTSEIIHCDEILDNNVKISAALRGFHNSSIKKAINSIKDNYSDCLVSAGSTGALMAIALFTLKTIPGINRPAIIGKLPTLQDSVYILDLGANVNCTEKNLIDFAILSKTYFQTLNGSDINPKIAILNIGTEETKGSEVIKNAYQKLMQYPNINFAGYIEPNQVFQGNVDIVVTDGFNGNIFLKTGIGVSKMFINLLKQSFTSNWITKICALFLKKALSKNLDKFNAQNTDTGGPLLGINGIVVKTRGISSKEIFANTIQKTFLITKNKMIDAIVENLTKNQ